VHTLFAEDAYGVVTTLTMSEEACENVFGFKISNPLKISRLSIVTGLQGTWC